MRIINMCLKIAGDCLKGSIVPTVIKGVQQARKQPIIIKNILKVRNSC